MYSKEELISKPIEELETIARTLGSDLSAADGAEALVNFIVGDFSEEEEKPKKKASTKKAEKTEGEEPVVKKKRGRPSKADLAARAAEEALKTLNDTDNTISGQPEELAISFTEESTNQSSEADNTTAADTENPAKLEASEDAAPKKKRSRRSKEEIFAAAQAKAAALAANNQKKHELESFEEGAEQAGDVEIPDFLINENGSSENIPEGEIPEGEGGLLSQFQEKVIAHNAASEQDAWEGDPGDGTDFIVVVDLPVEDHYASV